MSTATFRSGAATQTAASSSTTRSRWRRAWWCWTRFARSRPSRPTTWRAMELQGRQVRVVLGGNQRHAPADVHDAAQPAAAR